MTFVSDLSQSQHYHSTYTHHQQQHLYAQPLASNSMHLAQQSQSQSQAQSAAPQTELDKLWSLLSELSQQLTTNRQQTEALHARAEELKTQAVHAQTGYTLRRFNIDVSKEEFESELEKLNVSLVMENQALQQENRQVSILLKDYEGTLETVMAKFRAYAYATQQHHLDLTRHYESLLLSFPTIPTQTHDGSSPPTTSGGDDGSAAAAPTGNGSSSSSSAANQGQIDPMHLQMSLAHLGTLIRKAMRSLQGEDPEAVDNEGSRSASASSIFDFGSTIEDVSAAAEADKAHGNGSAREWERERERERERDVSSGGYIGRTASTNPHYIPTTSTSSLVSSPPPPPPAHASASTSSAFASTSSSSSSSTTTTSAPPAPISEHDRLLQELLKAPLDESLEREIELETLRRENEALRDLLRISSVEIGVGPGPAAESSGFGTGLGGVGLGLASEAAAPADQAGR